MKTTLAECPEHSIYASNISVYHLSSFIFFYFEGLLIWHIENFVPALLEEGKVGVNMMLNDVKHFSFAMFSTAANHLP